MAKPKHEKKKLLSRRDKGLRYPVEFVAAELGVDRKTLERRCEASGFHLNGAGLTFREAYDALSQKSESDSAIRRKRIADAEASEVNTLNLRNQFVFKTDHENIVKDLAVSTRVRIESAHYIPMESRRKLVKEVASIKLETAKSSHE
jgi:hydroxylamine reductase (hybrid-cluster protein)